MYAFYCFNTCFYCTLTWLNLDFKEIGILFWSMWNWNIITRIVYYINYLFLSEQTKVLLPLRNVSIYDDDDDDAFYLCLELKTEETEFLFTVKNYSIRRTNFSLVNYIFYLALTFCIWFGLCVFVIMRTLSRADHWANPGT